MKPTDREASSLRNPRSLQAGSIDAAELRLALRRTFEFRRTHPLPSAVPAAPAHWARPYAKLAEADRLAWGALPSLEVAVAAFLDPVLGSATIRAWNPATWRWE